MGTKRIKIRKIALLMLLSPVFLLGQEIRTLTLEESVNLALKQNPAYQIAEREYEKSAAAVWEAWSAILPSVSGSASYSKAWSIQENTIPNFIKQMLGPSFPGYDEMPDFVRLSFGLENTFRYGLTLNQPIFLGGAGIAGVQIAVAGKRASAENMEAMRQNLIYQTVNSFYGCLLAQRLVDVQDEALRQAEANLDLVLKKYEAGSASGFEKMRAKVEVANLKPEFIAARNNYEMALTGLRTVLGMKEGISIEVSGELEFLPDDMADVSLTELERQALIYRPELKGLEQQEVIAAKGVTIARSQFLPKIFFTTDYSFLAMKNDYNLNRDDFSKGFTSALSLSMPLFQGFKNHKTYQKAKLDYKIVIDSGRQIKQQILAEVENAYNNFREAQEKYSSTEESIGLAREALRLANLNYEEGAGTQLDVMGSQLALTRARLNHASALYEYQMARYSLRKVTGILKTTL